MTRFVSNEYTSNWKNIYAGDNHSTTMYSSRINNTPVLLGGVVLGVSSLLFVVVDIALDALLAQLSLPVFIGGLLILYGYRLDEQFAHDDSFTIAKWTLSGILALFLVGQWYVFLDWYVGQVTTVLAIFAAITTGVLFGSLIGIHAAQVNRRNAQLAERNEQLAASKARLAEKNERLEQFTSMVSHDLRNPLQVMGGFLDLAAETGDEEYFDRCEQQVQRMDHLIEDMLALSRADAESLETGPTSLPAVAHQVWETIGTGDATLETSDTLLLVADGGQIEQLIQNLINNSLDHGGTDVSITIGALPDEDGFYIEDDGPGIPPDDRDDIFEHGYSTGAQGTGYGLTIVERVIDVHDWKISVTESDDGGARFEICGVELVSGSNTTELDRETAFTHAPTRSPPEGIEDQASCVPNDDAPGLIRGP